MAVIVYVDEEDLKELKTYLKWATEDDDEVEISRLTAIINRLEEVDNKFIEIATLKEFGEFIEEFKDWDFKVEVSYSSHFEDFSVYVTQYD